MVEFAQTLIKKEEDLIQDEPSVEDAIKQRENFSSSVTVNIINYSEHTLTAIRTTPIAGEIEVPQSDVGPLTRGSLLCSRRHKPAINCGCAGTIFFRVGDTDNFLHVMWSSPNNFDKHASHVAVGITEEKNNKFNDMYYNKPSWFARKYSYHDREGLWFAGGGMLVYALMHTRPVADLDVYVFPVDQENLPDAAKAAL